MGSSTEKGIVWFRDDDSDIDSRLIRRMIRRCVSNKSSRDYIGSENNVAAAGKEVIAIDDYLDDDYAAYLDKKCSGIPGYVDLNDGRYDDIDVDITNVDKSSGGVANECADDGNAEANKCADDENAEASDVFIDPEYKSFLDNCRFRNHDILFCLGNEVITYGQTDDDGECSCKKRTCYSRTVDIEAKRSSKGFQKRGRMSVVGNRNNIDNQVGPVDNHSQATKSSKSKTEGSNKEGHNCGMELADNDPEYNLALNSMAVDATYGESVVGPFKKVRVSQDEKNQSDVEVLESNKQKKKSGVKLVDSSPQCYLLSSVAVNGRNKKSMTKHRNKVGRGEDWKDESDEEVTILELDRSSGGERTPFVSSKAYDAFVDDYKFPNSGRKISSEYMEELIKYLKKPYAKDEYSQLMEQVSRRKPVERDMDLRSGTKPFKTKVMGKSYLDLHNDLYSKIIEAKSDKLKVLNILRGFFFWLQNITREGAFRPWMDPSILDIRPQV